MGLRLAAFVVSLSFLPWTTGSTIALAQVKLPRLDYRDRTLANGLRVLSAEDRSSPHAIQVYCHVGWG
jgi:zinc protease